MKAWRLRSRVALATVAVGGTALAVALAVASPGSGGVSAVDGACNTTLAQAAGAGASSIFVRSTTGCDIGDSIVLNQGGGTEECQEIESVAAGAPMLSLVGTLAYGHSQGETVVEVPVCPTPTPVETETPPPTETATPTPTLTATPTPTNRMFGCPHAGKWSMAAWGGEDGIDANEALDTCGAGAVAAAYALDASSGEWLRRFRDRPEISNLSTFENMQGFFALGSSTASPTAAVEPAPAEPGQMRGCPLPGIWSIAVWDGPDADTGDALDTCGVWQVGVAYSLDPETGGWARSFRDRPELSTLNALPSLGAAVVSGVVDTSTKIAFTSFRDENPEIYVMKADGTAQTRITNHWAADSQPAWSPDRSKIAFSSWSAGNYGRDNYEIWVMNANGTGQTRLTNNAADDYGPAWSPDGSRIAFYAEGDGNEDILVMNANGTGQTRLTNNAADDSYPAWSPDGTKIAFESERDGSWEIYVMNANGTGQTRLTSNSEFDGYPAWSPDGSKIVFSSGLHVDWGWDMYEMNADGSGQTKLTNNNYLGDEADPSWSPDGTQIAFTYGWDIWVMNADGMGWTQLTTSAYWDMEPAWSP